MKRFYTTDIALPYCFLHEEEAAHCIKVLRGRVGDKVEILDGNGKCYAGEISDIGKKEVQITITDTLLEVRERPNLLAIAICPTKNPARLEWFIEKATEIGIDRIYPIISKRTEKQNIKKERLEQLIISAAKQSGQLHFPVLEELQSFDQLLKNTTGLYEQYMIAHCEDDKKHLKEVYTKGKHALLLIGPEGDFTDEEVKKALQQAYLPVSLGNSILRVETAGLMACATVANSNY